MSQLPLIRFSGAGLSPGDAFEAWRDFIGPVYDVRPLGDEGPLPSGEASCFLLGEVLVNRTVFGSQRVARDKRLIDSTPDHVILQAWRTGGYTGEVYGRPVSLCAGVAAMADRRRQLNGRISRADTVGVAIPRNLLAGLDFERVPTRLDACRGRLLTAEIAALYRRVPRLGAAEVPAEIARLLALVHRMFETTAVRDVLDGPEFDGGLLVLAERVIQRDLDLPQLDAQHVADHLRVSRATVYRLFAPVGGVMRHVQEQRLLAVHDALADALEMRTLTRIAADFGFGSPALLSRLFRARFGLPPSDWRRLHSVRLPAPTPRSISRAHRMWRSLGARGGPDERPTAG